MLKFEILEPLAVEVFNVWNLFFGLFYHNWALIEQINFFKYINQKDLCHSTDTSSYLKSPLLRREVVQIFCQDDFAKFCLLFRIISVSPSDTIYGGFLLVPMFKSSFVPFFLTTYSIAFILTFDVWIFLFIKCQLLA